MNLLPVANSVLLLTYRDVPTEMPVFVAANCAKENGTITPKGDNLFAAVRYLLCVESEFSFFVFSRVATQFIHFLPSLTLPLPPAALFFPLPTFSFV